MAASRDRLIVGLIAFRDIESGADFDNEMKHEPRRQMIDSRCHSVTALDA